MWIMGNRTLPVVNFIDSVNCVTNDGILNCFHFGEEAQHVRSPRIPVCIQGVRVPIIVDTGAELSILDTKFVQKLFPGQELPTGGRQVRSLGGNLISLCGPVTLEVEVCGLIVKHPFYYYDGASVFLMGFDLITAAALTIDAESRCVWSKHTLRCHVSQDLANAAARPKIEVENADEFITVPPTPYITPEPEDDQLPCQSSRPCYTHYTSLGPRASLSVTASTDLDDYTRMPVCTSSLDLNAGPFTLHSQGTSSHDYTTSHYSATTSPAVIATHTSSSVTVASVTPASHTRVADFCQSETPVPQDRSPDSDEDETQLKGAAVIENETELPEHVNTLFLQTLETVELTQELEQGLKQLLHDCSDVFAKSKTDIGFCPKFKHDIDTGDERPVRQSPRTPPFAARADEDRQFKEMLEAGIIEPSTSPWASPVCMAPKKDGTYRFCIDYRQLNKKSKKDAYPTPKIQDLLDNLRGVRYFATLDLLSGYWQLGMTERAKEHSAFCTRHGLFQFNRMPFGLCGAPSTFNRCMQDGLRDLLYDICLNYLDDIIVFARTPQELLQRLRKVLNRLREMGLKLKPSKCVLFKKEVEYLGQLVSERGIEPLPEKLAGIEKFERPCGLKEVRSFVGTASYYRRFIRNFSTIAEPLTKMTRKNVRFEWTEEAQEAFDKLKQALMDAASLAFPHPNVPCIVDTDASDVGIGAVLS